MAHLIAYLASIYIPITQLAEECFSGLGQQHELADALCSCIGFEPTDQHAPDATTTMVGGDRKRPEQSFAPKRFEGNHTADRIGRLDNPDPESVDLLKIRSR